MRALVGVVVAAGSLVVAEAQEHKDCPKMTVTTSQAGHGHQADVDHRHQDTTGVPSGGTRHHFLLAEDGGSIRLGVEDEGQAADRERIRAHLQVIARSFAAGDFTMPMRIHDQVPPGVDVMKARRGAIAYVYSESPEGGVVTLSTKDPEARAAIHEFLRFQIRDHATGDPLE